MTLKKFRVAFEGLVWLIAVAGLLSGCARSTTAPAGSGSPAGTGSGTQTTIQGVATPSSVSVVTAN